jgi:hypothetical protein
MRRPAEKLPMGTTYGQSVRIGCSRLPPLWREDEDTLRDKSTGCNPEDSRLPWSPREEPAHRPSHAG